MIFEFSPYDQKFKIKGLGRFLDRAPCITFNQLLMRNELIFLDQEVMEQRKGI